MWDDDRPVAIRLVLAEDNYIAREGLEQVLESCPEMEVVAAVRRPRLAARRGRERAARTWS